MRLRLVGAGAAELVALVQAFCKHRDDRDYPAHADSAGCRAGRFSEGHRWLVAYADNDCRPSLLRARCSSFKVRVGARSSC